MQLPDVFIENTRRLMGDERFEQYLRSFDEPVPVSIRLNPLKNRAMKVEKGERVPWCRNGYYLSQRPNFTMDPLFHAGCYYVQEAASMFLDEVLQQHLDSSTNHAASLDLCAAPGGKSTLLRSVLPCDDTLYSNEPNRKRASILLENVEKWGYKNHIVTNCYPRDFRKSKLRFDLILCDVPCSGEGMFRKDPDSIKEWSMQNVEHCWRLQREIVSEAWQCLNEGGLLIYSTCTFNTKENEENIRWMMEELDAEVLPVKTEPEWNITGSLLQGFDAPVYRFIPGITQGEGLFMAVTRKTPTSQSSVNRTSNKTHTKANSSVELMNLNLMTPFNTDYQTDIYYDVDYQTAISYLRGEAVILPSEIGRGHVGITFQHQLLGYVKNIGNRANNLYPKEWRIKSTHIPQAYEPVILPSCESTPQNK